MKRTGAWRFVVWGALLGTSMACGPDAIPAQGQSSEARLGHGGARGEPLLSDYKVFNAFNDIEITYTVLLPADYDPHKEYPAVLAFPSGEMGREAADEMTARFWPTPDARSGWIVVVPLVPGDDWRTHPNHHALNDLLDHINDEYSVQDDLYHIMGFGRVGSDIASTWSDMSREYFYSLTTTSGAPYRKWDDDEIRALRTRDGERLELLSVWGDQDVETSEDIEAAEARMGAIGHPMESVKIEGDDAGLGSLSGGGLLRLMREKLVLATGVRAQETSLQLESGQLVSFITSVTKPGVEELRDRYYREAFGLAETYGFRAIGSLRIESTRTVPVEGDGYDPFPVMSIMSWPDRGALEAFERDPAWPPLKDLRSRIWEELRIVRMTVPESVTVTFRPDRLYRVVSLWKNLGYPDDFDKYRSALAQTVANNGGRYVLELEGEDYHSFVDDHRAPELFWIIEWPSREAHAAYTSGEVFRSNVHYFSTGVAKFHVYETRTRQ